MAAQFSRENPNYRRAPHALNATYGKGWKWALAWKTLQRRGRSGRSSSIGPGGISLSQKARQRDAVPSSQHSIGDIILIRFDITCAPEASSIISITIIAGKPLKICNDQRIDAGLQRSPRTGTIGHHHQAHKGKKEERKEGRLKSVSKAGRHFPNPTARRLLPPGFGELRTNVRDVSSRNSFRGYVNVRS